MAGMKKTAKTGTVTDEQGRVRFHGAFTGGFSAGYFNTVGSSEGFQPAQFVSSRSNRASQQSGRSIADYMDEGDGLLGGNLSSVAGIDSFARSGTENIDQQRALDVNNTILNKQLLSELTVQAKPSDTIGKKLLATMGWRLGQGIGPRIAKKRVDYFSRNEKAGLTMEVHPGADLSKLPKSALLQNGSVTFAPDDEGQKIAFPPPKTDVFGLGFDVRLSGRLGTSSHGADFIVDQDEDEAYEGSSSTYRMSDIMRSGARGGHDKAEPNKRGTQYGQQTQSAKRLKYTSGFAYNDEEDDVYSRDAPLAITNSVDVSGDSSSRSLVAYDPANSGPEMLQNAHRRKEFERNAQETLQNINEGVDNWLGGGNPSISNSQGDLKHTLNTVERCPSDNRPPLPGFHVARKPRVLPPHYPPPIVPPDFREKHSFELEGEIGPVAASAVRGRRQNPLDAAKARSEKMSDNNSATSATNSIAESTIPEEPEKVSIFDLIKPEARLKLQNAIHAVNPASLVHIAPPPPLPPLPPTPPPPPPEPVDTPSNTTSNPAPASTSAASSTTAAPARPMLTSAHLLNSTFAGLAQSFKNRFASATTSEGSGTKDSVVLEGMATASQYTQKLAEKSQLHAAEASASAKAAPKVMQVKGSTRTVTPWAPAPLLCKRMNVRLPDISKTSAQLGAGSTTVDVVSALLGVNPVSETSVPLQFGRTSNQDTTTAEVQRVQDEAREAEAAALDVYQAPAVDKPNMAVFKSIFEDSDDEDEEVKEDEREEHRNSEHGGELPRDSLSTTTVVSEAKIAATSTTVAPAQSLALEAEEGDSVRFVPSKLRTTIAGRPGAASNKSRAVRTRTSFEDPDEESARDIVLTRQVRPRLVDKNASDKSSIAGVRENNEQEGDEEEEMFVAVGVSRAASQNTVSFGGGGLAGRARKSRTASAAGSLRERLLAQQREDGEDEEGKSSVLVVEKHNSKAAEKQAIEPKKVHPVAKNESTNHIAIPATARVTAIQTVINSNAADDFLADLSTVAATAPVVSAPGMPTSPQTHSESELVEGSVRPVLRANSRFAPASNKEVPVASADGVRAYLEAPVLPQQHPRDAAARDYFVPLPPPLPTPPAPPPPQAPTTQALTVQQPVLSTVAVPPVSGHPSAQMVLPPEAKFESSIQRLQNSLLASTDRSSASLREHKEAKSKKESKKSHKSHKSGKHKHKKDSKKDRKKDKKESKKSTKRPSDASDSGSESTGSSSDSE